VVNNFYREAAKEAKNGRETRRGTTAPVRPLAVIAEGIVTLAAG
jgi:hypothetical protein